MSENVIQTSLAGGELAPSLFAHVDMAKYKTGAAVMRNFFVDYRSGASTRPGTKFVIQAFNSDSEVRLIPFTYSVLNTYQIEFGDHYVRFISNGAAVLEADFVITAVTNGLPGVVTAPGNPFTNGDWVFIKDIIGMPGLNNRFFVWQTGALYDVNGNPVDTSALGTYVSGGMIARVYKIASPYAGADLPLLKYTQNANVMTLTHPSYPPYNLTLTAPTSWSFHQIIFGTTALAPSALGVVTSAAGAVAYTYTVTAIDALGQESPVPGFATVLLAVNLITTPGTNTISWTAAVGAVSYNVYKAEPSLSGSAPPVGSAFGFIGQCTGVQFIDSNIFPDYSSTPPVIQSPFAAGNNPSCSCYFQQRQTFAATVNQPETFWMGTPGGYSSLFSNFNKSDPVQEDDSIEGTLVSLQVNAIKSLVPMPGGLIALTAKGAWQISGGPGNAITPINAQAIPQAYNGASDVPPIIINYDILYVQAKGAIVRDLSYNLYVNIYTGADISVLSNHLFFGYQITGWAYSEEPFKVIWSVRNDGKLLSLTFVKEQEIYGWARHDTQGLFQSVSSVTEGQVDAVYVVVRRDIGGHWVKMIERFAERRFVYGAEDAWAVDCGVQSALTYPAAELTADAATGTVTFTTSLAVFSAGNVGSVIRIGGGIANITQFIDMYSVIGELIKDIDNVLPDDTPVPAASGEWSMTQKFTTFYGADHLEGQTVSILADGSVITPQVVVNGTITLAQPASKVTLGLAFTAQLKTMPLDVGEPTIQGKRKKVAALTVKVAETRGLSVGRTFDTLTPIKEMRPTTQLDHVMPLVTGDERIIMDPLWDVPGQICIQQDNPLPATVLGVVPEIIVGDNIK